ncbi:hypothetical protein EKO29_09430 [Colwellia sp. Arc7-635]|uniref:AMP-binding protein n=1 Tax=Colwellia sp. Arc7-635 TaxID=2497879 RepID=UPI000F8589B8|nr:AMP-binding protein [Colwellia sp. Arc7-635]AZQ84222.1 hypothetical protein EKO29_09430 [Colwellia sp. Arc7-635]
MMNSRLAKVWQTQKHKAMLIGEQASLNYEEFLQNVADYCDYLTELSATSVALCLDNSLDWILIDFACQQLDIVLLPLPAYFSAEQIQHSMSTAGCDVLIVDSAIADGFISKISAVKLLEQRAAHSAFSTYAVYKLSTENVSNVKSCLPPSTAKVTFTSGTTGLPKGVCLSVEHQWQVAESLTESFSSTMTKHLCVLPLSTLLENIAGIYAPLLNGTSVVVKSLASLGFNGSSSLNFTDFIQQISTVEPSSLITTPELLKGLVQACNMGWQAPKSLVFIAVGGAHVAQSLLDTAHAVGLPAFQGYGLSECCSVVSLNTVTEHSGESAGKVLSHLNIDIRQSEIIVKGPLFLGYAGDKTSWSQTEYATGDLGFLDDKGYLHIQGRKKNILISSFGRNINPEWLESRLTAEKSIKQAIVFGDAKPFCCAAIYVDDRQTSKQQVADSITVLNQQLPDYAQIKSWFYLAQAMVPNSELMTANGRVRRVVAAKYFKQEIDDIYQVERVM